MNFGKSHENHENPETLQLEGDCDAMEHRCDAIESSKIMISQKFLRCLVAEVSLVTEPFFQSSQSDSVSLHEDMTAKIVLQCLAAERSLGRELSTGCRCGNSSSRRENMKFWSSQKKGGGEIRVRPCAPVKKPAQ